MAETENALDLIGKMNFSKITPEESKRSMPAIYANQIQVGFTPWDIQMMFRNVYIVDTGKTTIENVATIIMSPQHAKVMTQILIQHIMDYERQHGVITLNLGQSEDDEQGEAEVEEKPKPEATKVRRRTKR